MRELQAAGQAADRDRPLRRRVPQEVRDRRPPASSSACSGLGLSLGSKKEARSAAFGLSHRRHLRLLRAHPAGRAGGRHRHAAALARHVGRQRRAGRRRGRPARAQPPRGRLRPARPVATTRRSCPRIRRARAEAGAAARRRGRPGRPAARGRVVVLRIPRWVAAHARPPRPLHRALVPGQVRAGADRVLGPLRAGRASWTCSTTSSRTRSRASW